MAGLAMRGPSMNRLMLRLYALVMWLSQPLLRRKLARRGQLEPGYGYAVAERFGHYSQPLETRSELVWLHAVSLGETRTAAPLLAVLREHYPDLRILLTHGTATGREAGRALLRAGDVQVWQPWDSPAVVRRFLHHFKPRLGLLMETEVWPVTLAEARRCALPMLLVNARLSEKSLAQALRLASLSRPAYSGLSAVLAQTEADASRFARLGVTRLSVSGNLKFDVSLDAALLAKSRLWKRAEPLLLFASSRKGEEIDFLSQIRQFKDQPKRLVSPRFLLVPRHPQRFDEVAELARGLGLSVSRRSSWSDAGPSASAEAMQADVWLGDSLGEMALYYALADAALLGGSFAPLGGQNLIEAAACACPIVMGPHTFNFAQAAEQAQACGAAQRVADMTQGFAAAMALISHPQQLSDAARASLAFAAGYSGAARLTFKALQPFLRD
ncbi:3-deoxy-D-manno-octulosonic acid transferase [Polaromonas vacuolata]|uniref:3-deoxy-D-manno-octulosonic acid transferase n=2 Tax=Polaromonas vacuolata TaxID=37448 RepID=A0A6H2HC21_9BURK|nr:3-deoxy-D-manno-octulosonic acid transferase [Polaromonas vacuolata]